MGNAMVEWITKSRDGVSVRVWRWISDKENEEIYIDILGPRGGIYAAVNLSPREAMELSEDIINAVNYTITTTPTPPGPQGREKPWEKK